MAFATYPEKYLINAESNLGWIVYFLAIDKFFGSHLFRKGGALRTRPVNYSHPALQT